MAVIYLEKSSVDSLTEADIKDIIDENSAGMKYDVLDDYYEGKHKILSEYKRDSTAPNNKIVNNMAKYITDTAVGYFVGNPVVYSSQSPDYIAAVQNVFDYNDEQDHNTELAKKCSIYGSCFEMLYIDEDCKIRLARVAPQNIIMIYETGYSDPLAAIRTVISRDKNKNTIRKVEFWDSFCVWYFRSINGGNLELIDIQDHYWHDIPFTEYINNDERLGDFEGVVSIVDAYNRVQSNTANLFQYNDEALLKITKMGDVSTQDVRDMKEKGAIILEDGGDIAWLLKTIDDTAMENYKKRLREDMHIFSSVPNMTDDSFGSQLSGVAVSYKLWGLEQICAIKQRKFKKGLQRRIELITNILNIQGSKYDWRDIEIQFRRNKPQNLLETAQIITTLSNDLSRESRLKMLPTVDNVQDELDKLEAERKKSLEEFGNSDELIKAIEAFGRENSSTESTELEAPDGEGK